MKRVSIHEELQNQASVLNHVIEDLHSRGRKVSDLNELIEVARKSYPWLKPRPDLLRFDGCMVYIVNDEVIREKATNIERPVEGAWTALFGRVKLG